MSDAARNKAINDVAIALIDIPPGLLVTVLHGAIQAIAHARDVARKIRSIASTDDEVKREVDAREKRLIEALTDAIEVAFRETQEVNRGAPAQGID
jgi:hypothetical protein